MNSWEGGGRLCVCVFVPPSTLQHGRQGWESEDLYEPPPGRGHLWGQIPLNPSGLLSCQEHHCCSLPACLPLGSCCLLDASLLLVPCLIFAWCLPLDCHLFTACLPLAHHLLVTSSLTSV